MRKLLINRLELPLSLGNVIARGDLLRADGASGHKTSRIVTILRKSKRHPRATPIDLRRLVAVMLGQNRAHLEVSNAHFPPEGHRLCFLLGIDGAHVLPVDILRHVPVVDLRDSHHLVLARHLVSEVDVRSGEFFLQAHWVGLETATSLLHEGRFGLAGVGACLAEVDGVRWLGDGLLFGDLAAVPLALADAVVGLALGGDGSATPVDVLQ